MMLTDFMGSNPYRNELGMVLVALVSLSVAVNIIKFVNSIIVEIMYKRRLERVKKLREQVEKEQLRVKTILQGNTRLYD